jgi:hypothetical protein
VDADAFPAARGSEAPPAALTPQPAATSAWQPADAGGGAKSRRLEQELADLRRRQQQQQPRGDA